MRAPNDSNQRLLDDFNRRDRRRSGVMIQVSATCNFGCVAAFRAAHDLIAIPEFQE